VITGASSGVGRALALQMAHKDVGLMLCGRNVTALQAVANECANLGCSAIELGIGDVGSKKDVANMWETYTATFGNEIDVLVANAGLNRPGAVEQNSEAEYEQVMNTNLKGVWLWLQHAVPLMKQQHAGQIVVTNSVRGIRGGPNAGLYTASKFAVRGLMQCVRHEVRPFGVKVGSVLPGGIATPWWDDAERGGRAAGTDTSQFLTADAVATALVQLIEQPESSDIEEILLEPTAVPDKSKL